MSCFTITSTDIFLGCLLYARHSARGLSSALSETLSSWEELTGQQGEKRVRHGGKGAKRHRASRRRALDPLVPRGGLEVFELGSDSGWGSDWQTEGEVSWAEGPA